MYFLSLFQEAKVGGELSTLATTLQNWIKYLTQIGMPVVGGILVAAIVFFATMLAITHDVEKRDKWKKALIWSSIGFVIILVALGLSTVIISVASSAATGGAKG
ncbi:pilin [Mesomycoplasma ovipneumoniae]|uniref:Pilin n=1 Tax=Mesomycoplasma ovipneumoniae TaxID=29562 RepID=A0AAJ2P8X7_9BACT|nr:pilin [Mesomycoplasma ovipneumoniae]MDW2906670.1 pilin [Mesomycoplasma ovipneumoniae]MDW2914589.1 pilin [Mesomycoplasma ovipneumoniae]WNM14825.1 pilin [Mesomycoplasma ovipneumoniae]